jgi:hypothetical protein
VLLKSLSSLPLPLFIASQPSDKITLSSSFSTSKPTFGDLFLRQHKPVGVEPCIAKACGLRGDDDK